MLPLPRGAVWQLLFLFCAALYINGVRSEGRVVCYYTNWSVYRPGTAKFNPQNINPYLCTHLIYAFGGFTKDNQMKPFDKYQDIEQGGYAKFTGLKTYNKQLKTMIAIGGWNEASSRFSPLVAYPERRQKFIKNMLKFLRQNHFDGIDLDWEYPAHREGGKARDRDNYAQFVQELRAEFEREAEKTGRPRLLVTMAVPAGIEYIEKGYDIPKLNKYLDWFNVLTYDFHSSHEPSVNHHAPLYSLEEESEYNYDSELNIDYSIKFYLNAGADKDKLVLGIPTYGRSYTLINEESTEIGAPAEAPGDQGDATREKGYLAYYEICQNLKEDPEWTVVQPNPNAMGPYAYRRNQWVGYDDEAIVRKKAQYVVDNGLGGIMFWAIDNDDFRGTCSGKPYPLIEAAKDAMLEALGLGINEVSKPSAPQKPSRSRSRENSSSTRNRITTSEQKLTYAERKGSSKRTQTAQENTRNKQQSTTTAPLNIKLTEVEGSSLYIGGRTTTPPPPTTPDPGTDFKCEDEGFFQHPRDCKKYYWCLDSGPSGLGIVAHMFTCPSGLYFNPAADSCDFARNVPCKTKKSTTAAPVTSAPTTTTTARPTSSVNRLTATPTRTSFYRTTSTTTTTTTEAPEEDETEYEEDEDNVPSPFAKQKGSTDKEAEEDPKVIKELIELIRKVGGIEELEKHLLRQDDGTIAIKENSSSSSSTLVATTPSSISKSLYEKVLSKPNALNSFRNRFISTSSFRNTQTKTEIKALDETKEEVDKEESDEIDNKRSGASAGYSKYSSVVRGNGRQGPQNEGIEKLTEFEGFLKEKKQYTTINRNRVNKKIEEEDEEEESVIAKSQVESREDDEEVTVAKTTKRPSSNTPSYSTIRRTRPSTTTEATEEIEEHEEEKEVNERKSYSSLNRNRARGTTTTEIPDVTEATAGATRYKYLERTRPTRPTTESSNKLHDEEEDDDDNEEKLEDHKNTVQLKANENTRETQQQKDITTNTQRAYASIGRRTTTTATPETETTTIADKIVTTTTTTTATPTTSTTETPITTTTTPLTNIETTNIPITTTTNPITLSTTTTSTTTTTLPNGEEVLESLTTTPNPNEINTDTESLSLSLNVNSLITESKTEIPSSSTSPTTESGLDTKEQEIDSYSTETTTEANDIIPKTEVLTEEVNLVSKQRNKTLYTTRGRTTTTTTPPQTTTTTTDTDIETTTSPTNTKKPLGVRRQQLLLNRSSQTKTTTPIIPTTDLPPTPTTESVNNDFLGTVSSPRPFGFPKRRTRPTASASVSTTSTTTSNAEDILKPNEESLVTKQKTTKLNAAVNTQAQKKYKFQRRTTTTTSTTTTTTERPVEAIEENNDEEDDVEVVTKAQVNDNEREISTNISETTAPTTESPSSPATPVARRIKVLKFKRPVVSNITSAIESSVTNFNASHTETQNIDKLSSVSEVDEQLVKTHTLTDTETQTDIPIQTSPTPKRFRKVIRKLIRPVNRTTEIVKEDNAEETETIIKHDNVVTTSNIATSNFSQRRQNITRFGLNRSTKFSLSNQKSHSEENEEEEDSEEKTEERTPSAVLNRGRNKFTLPSGISTTTRTSLYGTANRNRYANRPQSSQTTEETKTATDDEEENEEETEEDEEDVKETTIASDSKNTAGSIYTSSSGFRFSRPSSTTPAPLLSKEHVEEDNTEDSTDVQLDTTTQEQVKESSSSKLLDLQKLRNKVRIDSSKQQDVGLLSDRFKTTKSEDEEEEKIDDPLLRLRNKVKQDSVKGNQDDGVLSNRFKTTKSDDDEEEEQTDNPLLKLRNKVKQDLAKGNQEEGVLSNRFKTTKTEKEEEDESDDPLLKLRNKVKQDLAKGSQEEGIVSFKLKKLLETKSSTSSLNYKVEDNENDSVAEQDSLKLQKIRDKVQTNLAKGEQDQGVVSSRLKKLLAERTSNTDTNSVEEFSKETTESSGDHDIIEQTKPFTPRRPFVPNNRAQLTKVETDGSSQEQLESSTSTPKVRPTFRRKLIAKRPYVPTKPPLSALATTTVKIPSTAGKKKYVRRKFGRFHPFNAVNRNTGEGYIRKDPRGNLLPGADRFKVEGSAGGHIGESEDYEEYDEEGEEEEDQVEEEVNKPAQPDKPLLAIKPVIARPPGLFNRPQTNILKKPPAQFKEQGSGETENEDEEDEEEEDTEDEEADEEEEKNEDEEDSSAVKQTDTPIINRPTYKPKDNRIPPGARPNLNSNGNKPFTPSRLANTPNRPRGSAPITTPSYGGNRFSSSSRNVNKPRVINRPPGVAAPNLTLKPVAKDFERTTVLIPTKPAPFINPNTHAYERKYSGPSTEATLDQNHDNNPLIEDLNIEALNARNKKIFETHSKKHTNSLKQKVLIPFGNLNENTQQHQEHSNTENENDEGYQSSVNDGYITTTTTTNTLQATTQDNTLIGTHNTEDEILSNVINLNEISSQDGSPTTPPPSTTLLHIFTLSDDEHTTRNPLDDANLVVTRHGEKAKPKHKVVEINRIVEVNSKEEKLRRKAKANTIRTVEGSQTFKVESLPHVEQLGEISVVKYVHQVEGSDITIEGRSTVTDYTPTEPTLAKVSQPVRNSYPEGNEQMDERNGKALLPEVIREAVESSTISLEGLFENARKGKVLNTIDDVAFTQQQQQQETTTESFKAATESSTISTVETTTESSNNKQVDTATESFNILKSIAFDIAKINLEPNSGEIETSNKSLESTSSTTTTTSESSSTTSSSAAQSQSSSLPRLSTTLAPETLQVESSTVASEEVKATTVAAALFPQYVRPIVPLLRPESNESSPLVISIANLDKVILSKVKKMENGQVMEEEEDEEHHQQVNKNNITPNPQTVNPETITITTIIPNNNNNPTTPETQTETIPQLPDINDSNGAFSSRLASVVKAPHLNSLQQEEKQLQNPLDKAEEVTQTELYTINEGPSVGSTTSSTLGSKVNEIVSFSSETTVVRTRKAKSRKFKNKDRSLKTTSTTSAPTTVLVSES